MRQSLNKFLLSFTLIAAVLFQFSQVRASNKLNFYYYNPDSIQSNFSHLSREIKNFFNQAGISTYFQAFTQKTDFDRMVKENEPTLVFVPYWYFQDYSKVLDLSPLLVPLHNGKTTYKKILLVRRSGIDSPEELAGQTLAMTTMGEGTEKLLTSNFFKKHGLNFSEINIINTPKDADALYALALGQVDAALVGEATLEAVREVNENIVEAVEELFTSSPIPMPILCLVDHNLNDKEVNKLKRLFMNRGEQSSIPTFMKMLQINGWKNAKE